MAKVTVASNYGLNMGSFDFSAIYYGWSYVQSGTLFRVDYGDGAIEEFRGTGFRYNTSGEPTAGTVTSYAAFYNGQRLFYVEGGAVAATKIVTAARTYSTSDDLRVVAEVLKGNDTISGGNYADVLYGFDGNDFVAGNGGNDTLYGHAGNDTIHGGSEGDYINGGTGVDSASYAGSNRNVIASLSNPNINTNDAIGDQYASIENLIGTNYSDALYGNGSANTLEGGSAMTRSLAVPVRISCWAVRVLTPFLTPMRLRPSLQNYFTQALTLATPWAIPIRASRILLVRSTPTSCMAVTGPITSLAAQATMD